ncbi:MAG: hypothetical protein PHT69_16870 [Bacteroidales bacterium]|nr:hypothetical protein [Bacteroidales bacterium]
MEKEKNKAFDSSDLMIFFVKWFKPLLIVGIAAIVFSVLFSSPLFITPKYKSTVVMFPTATNSLSKALLSENTGGKQDILEFGEQEQAEQLLQILNSSEIRDRIVEKHGLMAHYEIDNSSKFKMTRLFKEYENNIKFRRTEFMAVEIAVMDKDPQKAADIANDISMLLDTVMNRMQKERSVRGFEIVEREYMGLINEIKVMEDSMSTLRKLGVHDYESQSQVITEQLAIALAANNSRGVTALENQLEVLAEYAGSYVSLRDALEHEKKQLSHIKSKYEEAKVDAEQNLPHKFIVDRAYKAEKKSYPVRWLIVLITTFFSLLLAVITIVLIEKIKTVKPVSFPQINSK